MGWYLDVLKNYMGFDGRASRTEFWMFTLFNAIVSIVLYGVYQAGVGVFLWLYVLYALAVLLPSLAVMVRRLHDTGRPGLWVLIAFVPFVGAIVLLVFACQPSQPSPNQYGAGPKLAPAAA